MYSEYSIFLQFFYSPLNKEVELLGIDRRYESDIDGIGRIPAHIQIKLDLDPSYNVIGNFPVDILENRYCKKYFLWLRILLKKQNS